LSFKSKDSKSKVFLKKNTKFSVKNRGPKFLLKVKVNSSDRGNRNFRFIGIILNLIWKAKWPFERLQKLIQSFCFHHIKINKIDVSWFVIWISLLKNQYFKYFWLFFKWNFQVHFINRNNDKIIFKEKKVENDCTLNKFLEKRACRHRFSCFFN